MGDRVDRVMGVQQGVWVGKRVMASVYGGRRVVYVAPWGDTAHCIRISGRLLWYQEGYSQGGSKGAGVGVVV